MNFVKIRMLKVILHLDI